MRPDKAKIVDEIWDDDRIESFLRNSPVGDETNVDYGALLIGYRSMRPEDFRRFVEKFLALGRDLNARSNLGLTLLETIATHRHATPFESILKEAMSSADHGA